MIERFFSNETTREKLLEGLMGPYLPRLGVKLLELGYNEVQIRRLLRTASGLGNFLHQAGISLSDAGNGELETYSANRGRTRTGRRTEDGTGLSTIQLLMKPYGILSKPSASGFDAPCLEQFETYQRTVQGLTETTCSLYRRYLSRFILGLCHDGPPDWKELNGPYISHFLTVELDTARAAKRQIVAAIRSFLRFLISKGLIARGYLRAIPKVRSWRYSGLPHPLTVEEHQLVLTACQSESSGTRRDRAFVAFLAQLGVRGGELRQLRLDDIDWKEGILHIRYGKSNRERTLPLPKEAGELLADYIRLERPHSIYREIFLTSMAPREPFRSPSPTYLVRNFLGRVGIRGPRLGSHCFRHTAATLMVRNGATIKQVADVLGHQSIATTKIYVKLDEPSLQCVALPWPGGAL